MESFDGHILFKKVKGLDHKYLNVIYSFTQITEAMPVKKVLEIFKRDSRNDAMNVISLEVSKLKKKWTQTAFTKDSRYNKLNDSVQHNFPLGAAVWTIAKAQNGSRDCEHYEKSNLVTDTSEVELQLLNLFQLIVRKQ
ncbi:unnamed protein product [Caenorhabditis nigoni]